MDKRVSAYCCIIPIGIYAAYSLSMQLLFDAPFMAKSMLLSIIPSAIYLICFWKLQSSKRKISVKSTLLSNSLLALLLICLINFVRSDTESALIAGIAVHSVIAFIFAGVVLNPRTYRENSVLRDERTGDFYVIRGGIAQKLSENEIHRFNMNEINSVNFSSNEMSNRDSEINFTPINSSSNDTFSHGITINPSSGMPMTGGISGLDIHGNSWGTNFNEPSNTYDPNRGY